MSLPPSSLPGLLSGLGHNPQQGRACITVSPTPSIGQETHCRSAGKKECADMYSLIVTGKCNSSRFTEEDTGAWMQTGPTPALGASLSSPAAP